MADPRCTEFEQQGFTLFRSAYDTEMMDAWRLEWEHLHTGSTGPQAPEPTWWFGNMLERSPSLMWPAVSNPVILDVMEQLVGPRIQLDNLTLAAFESLEPAVADERPRGWHRDRWAYMPGGVYQRPLAMNAICYLQDLTEEFGQLRIIPGSHVEPVSIPVEYIHKPHSDEVVVPMQAGDVVLTHNGLLHSGAPNTSGQKRFFFSVYYNLSWLKHTDTFGGPNCQSLIAWARQRRDHRALRLLGQDEQLQARGNSGFQVPDEQRWVEWSAADHEAMAAAESSS